MAAVREINILLFGEIGAGKSLFINGIANYLAYQTLEEAELNKLINLISIKFKVMDDNYDTRVVTSGQVDHAEVEDGHSETQTCRAYTFHFGQHLIRFIDTPGIGDVRGIGQDRMNIENIMSFLGQYTELHAVCIVMKPIYARATVEFHFCLRQLLLQLAMLATQNIFFVFTKTRSTFYRPGEALPVLRKVFDDIAETLPNVNMPLNQNTVFCLDNEGLRYLVAVQNGIRFTQEQKRDFACSWRKSLEESRRLINTIIGNQ